jgi:hypothetical protein
LLQGACAADPDEARRAGLAVVLPWREPLRIEARRHDLRFPGAGQTRVGREDRASGDHEVRQAHRPREPPLSPAVRPLGRPRLEHDRIVEIVDEAACMSEPARIQPREGLAVQQDAVEPAGPQQLAPPRPGAVGDRHDLGLDAPRGQRLQVRLYALPKRRVGAVARQDQESFRLGHGQSFRGRL